jgi:precorrin 3B synthase CobZ
MAVETSTFSYDLIVVGGGNAGFSAGLAASQAGANNILIIDKCPESWVGGNSFFTAGAFRTAHSGLLDLLPLVNNVDAETAKLIDMESYTEADFLSDLDRVTSGRSDPDLGKALVSESNAAIKWLAELGIRFQFSFNRQAFKVNGRYKFFGGLALKTQDGGAGLIVDHRKAAAANGLHVWFSTSAKRINFDPTNGVFESLIAEKDEKEVTIFAKGVVLAAGGFEANPSMRETHLGPGWSAAHVRGTPYNTGDLLEIAVRDANARRVGQWSGCHAVAWDANSSHETGNREINNEYTKSGYPLGVTLNVQGERFIDEGSDLRNYTYAKIGKAILGQPGGVAFQVYDSKAVPWLRSEEYRDEIVEKIHGDSIEDLGRNCAAKGLADVERFVQTLKEYNKAVYEHRKITPDNTWDPATKDGLSTQSSAKHLEIPKSNWALPIDESPFLAIKVGCGVTFTFGGLAIDPDSAGLLSEKTGKTVPGVYCAGEMVGGLFWDNYPGGSGLTAGTVFGRKAGMAAAEWIRRSVLSS